MGPAAWRGGSALVLFALLAACGSGGGTTGGGGNGGGGRRQGGYGNDLTLTPKFVVENYHGNPRTETVRASVPFTQTMVRNGGELSRVGVRGHQCAWLPLQYWPDGSVKLAQAQFTDSFAGSERRTYEVARDVGTLNGPFERNEWVTQLGGTMRLGARVTDTFGVRYEGVLNGIGEILQETYLVRVARHRTYHVPIGPRGIDRDYLASTFYITEYRDMPFLTVDWILGNDYLGADDTNGKTDPNFFPLGPIDVKQAAFLARGMTDVVAQYPGWHEVAPRVVEGSGWHSFVVMSDTYLDDGQTRRYRFHLRFEHPNADPEVKALWRQAFQAFVEEPLQPLATLKTWQGTGALGLHGGPMTGPADAWSWAEGEWAGWAGNSHFGTWGTFGDVKFSGTTGTPRNHPVSPELAHAIQGEHSHLLVKLEQMAWIQSVRTYHLYGLQVGAEQMINLWDSPPIYDGSRDLSPESLGRRALRNADPYPGYRTMVEPRHAGHGWNWYDSEHWSSDLLFDYWTISGDAWAKEELRQLGESLKGLMRLVYFNTAGIQAARAEGWAMVGFVQSYLATQDEAMRAYAQRRIRDTVDWWREKLHPSRMLTYQENYPGTGFPGDHKFYMPWQHGSVLYGFLAAHKFFGDATAMQIAEDVVPAVEYAWVTNFQDPRFGFVANGLRYYCPTEHNGVPVPANHFDNVPGVGVKWGDSPLGGAHTFLTSGLFLLADRTENDVLRAKALHYGKILLGPLDDGARWYKWNLLVVEDLIQ
jgi:hypothetical protein